MRILLLSKILFGWGRGGWKGRGHCHDGKGGRWREHMKAKWEKMTPEERGKFKGSWGKYCRWEVKMDEEENQPETKTNL